MIWFDLNTLKSNLNKQFIIFSIFIFFQCPIYGQSTDDYNLWLAYTPIVDNELKSQYTRFTKSVYFTSGSDILSNAHKELGIGFEKMLGTPLNHSTSLDKNNSLIVALEKELLQKHYKHLKQSFKKIKEDGFIIKSISISGKKKLLLSAKNDKGILYGVFRLLHLMQTQKSLNDILLVDSPEIDLRMLNHWDNLDRTIERGYAGFSIWNWQKLPKHIDQRYVDYARANASIGINAVTLTNVNANALVLTPMYLKKVKALADVFRGYGIQVYLTARFSAPIEIGKLKTADPLNLEVQNWWNNKASEIYNLIPDFGGFLVKANSEGQPGPQNYGRNHVDGANMLAIALEPFGGYVMWRAFVYSEHDSTDRAKQAYSEFVPFDGAFKDNVFVQVKNGAIDFQPREPFHPMFGAMPKTPLMIEFQITQEYTGQGSHLMFLPKLFEEVLQSDTYKKGNGSTVAKVIDGSLHGNNISGMAGVSNIGNDLNWTGHPFSQANWYGFGRLAWDPYLRAETIAEEWIRATYSNDIEFVTTVKKLMLSSREALVNYMNPLGLHHIFNTNHHYGPGPWVNDLGRPDWNPVYYHRADSLGIGFDRTSSGSNALEQYDQTVAEQFGNMETCPEENLLWFHHLPWDYTLKNGNNLWDGIALKYQEGVNKVNEMITLWESVKPFISENRHQDVNMLLRIQLDEAKWWRDACLSYFQFFSKRPLPKGVEKPKHSLEYYKSLKFPFAPGIRPQWE